jgi:hypothetical protein
MVLQHRIIIISRTGKQDYHDHDEPGDYPEYPAVISGLSEA